MEYPEPSDIVRPNPALSLMSCSLPEIVVAHVAELLFEGRRGRGHWEHRPQRQRGRRAQTAGLQRGGIGTPGSRE